MTNPVCSSYSGITLDETTTPIVGISFQPVASAAPITFTSNPATNGGFAAFTASIVLSYPIPPNGALKIYLPYQNQDFVSLGVTSLKSMLPSNLATLTATATFLDATNNSVSLGTVSVVGDSGGQTVSIYFTNTSYLLQDGTLSVTISSLLNPPSFYPLSGFKVQTGITGTLSGGTKTQYGIEIVSLNTNTLTTNAAGVCLTSKATASTTSTIAQTGSAYTFSLVTINTIPKGGFFTLKVPSSVVIPGNTAAGFLISCNTGCTSTSAAIAYDATNTIMSFKNIITTNQGLIGGSTLAFTVTGWTNPSTFTPASFAWSSYAVINSSNYAVDSLASVTITVPVGVCSLSSAVASDSNTQIYAIPLSYSITMKCTSQITSTYELNLIWPSPFFIQNGACTLGNLSTGYSCTATSSTNTILMKTFTSSLPGKTNFSFTVTGIRNPGTFGTIGSIKINLTTTGGALTTDTGTFTFPDSYFTAGTISEYTVTPKLAIVNQNPDTYTFVLFPSGDIWAGSTVSLTMSSDVSIASASALATSCGSNLVGLPGSTIQCSLINKTINVSAGFPTATTNIQSYTGTPAQFSFDIDGFIDPPTIKSAAWKATIIDSTGLIAYNWASTTTPIVTMKQGTCTITAITPQNKQFYAIPSFYSFTLSCMQQLDSKCGIQITFPTANFYVALTSSCVFTGQGLAYSCSAVDTTGIITITSFASTTIASNTNFSFNVNSIRNPGQSTGIAAISIKTLKSDLTTLDAGSYTIPDNTFTTSTINDFTVTPLDYTVSTTPTSYIFSVTPQGDIPAGSVFYLNIPQNGPIIPSPTTLTNNCGSNLSNVGVPISCLVSGLNIKVLGFPATSQITKYQYEMGALQFQIDNLQNPTNTAISSAFTFQINSSTGQVLYLWSSSTSPTIQMSQGTCTISSISPLSVLYYDIPSSYSITMSCMQAITAVSGIQISFPTADFYLANTSTCKLIGQGTTYTCSSNSQTGVITITNFAASTISGNTLFTLGVDSIRNSGHTSGLGAIKIKTLKSNGNIQDVGTYTIPDNLFTTNGIIAFTVTPQNFVVNTSPVSYTFSVTPVGDIPANSVFTLSLPTTNGPTIPSTANLITDCGINLSNNSSPLTCSVSSSTITISSLPATTYITGYTSVMPALQFQIKNLKNPINTSQSSNFQLRINSSTGLLIYLWQYSNSPTVQMTQGLCNISLVLPTTTNWYAIPASYGFALTCMQALTTQSGVQITFPTADFTFLDGICSVSQSSLLAQCNLVAATGVITVSNLPFSTIASNTNFSFTVTNIRNPFKLAGIGSISISTLTSGGTVLDTGTYVWPPQTFTYGLIQAFTVTTGSSKVSVPTSFTFTLTLQGDLPAQNILKITLPTSVQVTSAQTFLANCGNDISTSTSYPLTCSISGQIITVSGIQKTSSIKSWQILTSAITINLGQLTNPPNVNPTTPFGATFYDSTGNTIYYTWQSVIAPVIQMTQGIITITSITATDNTSIFEIPSSYTFVIKNMVTIQTTFKLLIQFPEDFFINTNVKCTQTGFLSPSTTCIANANTYSIILQNIVSAPFVSNQFSFTVDSIRNPGSLGTLGGPITIQTQTSSSTLVDTGTYTMPTGYFTYSKLTAFTVLPLTGGINATPVDYTFTVLPQGNILQGSQIIIVLPAAVIIPNTATFIAQVGSGLTGFSSTSFTVTLGSDNRTITISQGFLSTGVTSINKYSDVAASIQFTLSGFTNPGSTNQSGAFAASIVDINNVLQYKWLDTTKPTITMTNGICVAKVIRPIETDKVYGLSIYEFDITCMQDIPVGSTIMFTFPIQFTIYNSNKCTVQQSIPNWPYYGTPFAANSGYTCSTNYLTKQLIIKNFQTKTLLGNTMFGILVSSFMNAGVIGVIGLFNIQTFNPQGAQLDSGTYDFQDSLNTPNTILQFQVQALNSALNQAPVTYRFRVTPPGDVMKGAIFQITYPPQISIPNPSGFTNCPGTFFSGVENTFTCSVNTNRVITITGLFASGGTSNLQIPDGSGKPPDFYFELVGFQNPSSNSPTAAFSVQIFDPNNVLYYQWLNTAAPVLSASGLLSPISAGFWRTNTSNGQIADYEFFIVPFSILSDGNTIQIVLPPEVQITPTTICKGSSVNLTPALTCTSSGQTVSITLKLARRRFLQNNLEVEAQDLTNQDQSSISQGLNSTDLNNLDQSQITQSFNSTVLNSTTNDEDIQAGSFKSQAQLLQFMQQKAATSITSGTFFSFIITQLINPPSFKPTASIQYFALNSGMAILEQTKVGMPVVNDGQGFMNACNTGIVPGAKDQNASPVYTITVSFNNYYQNLNIVVTVPVQITIGGLTCQKVSGIVSTLTCVVQNTNQILLKEAVSFVTTNPGSVVIQINGLINPSAPVNTDSFIIQTQTPDGYPIDQLSYGLVIDFRCSTQCQSCSSYADHCYSCYPTSQFSFYNQKQGTCDSNCLSGSTLVPGNGGDATTCKVCASPAFAMTLTLHAFAMLLFVATFF